MGLVSLPDSLICPLSYPLGHEIWRSRAPVAGLTVFCSSLVSGPRRGTGQPLNGGSLLSISSSSRHPLRAQASAPSNATLASDFVAQGLVGAAFFDLSIDNLYCVRAVLPRRHAVDLAWFFFKALNVAGAGAAAVVAACLVRPFVDNMTESEIHFVMTSGRHFCERQGLAFVLFHHRESRLERRYKLGCPAQNLITVSIMSIPASIAISMLRVPELG
ncbi:hypothetical protein EDB83DRAFT_2527319 [Lactarius deliciosus]|nr:hypothetical protein EDB83DRAFT_2527319 [Lactarius deliciosus]